MSSSQFSLPTRVTTSFKQLSSAAADLNAVSDALGKAVADIDEGLKKLNLGITAWVEMQKSGGAHGGDLSYTIEELGYAKINGKWGIAVRVRSGDEQHSEYDESVEVWLFNEAGRALRLKAIARIPELLNKLNQEAAKATKELQAQLADARAVAAAVQEAAREPKSPPYVTGAVGRAIVARGSMTPPPRAPGSPDPNAAPPEAKL